MNTQKIYIIDKTLSILKKEPVKTGSFLFYIVVSLGGVEMTETVSDFFEL